MPEYEVIQNTDKITLNIIHKKAYLVGSTVFEKIVFLTRFDLNLQKKSELGFGINLMRKIASNRTKAKFRKTRTLEVVYFILEVNSFFQCCHVSDFLHTRIISAKNCLGLTICFPFVPALFVKSRNMHRRLRDFRKVLFRPVG